MMQNFGYWHTYFDSIFLKQHPVLPLTFIQEMNIAKMSQMKWPGCPHLPELPKLLSYLQTLLESDSWKQCNCQEKEAKIIQSRLNSLATLLAVQKNYAIRFWDVSKRRVQASTVHYFILLKRLFWSIIPDDLQSLSQAVKSNKLCLQMARIELIMKYLLSQVSPIYNFLLGREFNQEKVLVEQLFRDITVLCRSLPQLPKDKLQEIPKLMRYICINNPLDSISQSIRQKSQIALRPRSNTLLVEDFQKPTQKQSKDKDCASENSSSFRKSTVGNKSERVRLSSIHQDAKPQILHLFRFRRPIHRSEKRSFLGTVTISSKDCIRKDSLLQSPKLQRYRSTTVSMEGAPQIRGLKKTTLEKRVSEIQESSIDNVRSKTFGGRLVGTFFDQTKKEDRQFERKDYNKIKKCLNSYGKFSRLSQLIELSTGKRKGWALVREYLFKNIVERKLRKILLQ